MMKKCSLILTASMFISMISFSQTIKENIEKQSKDPKTVDNAAKADVYIANDKKKISNTVPEENQNRMAKNTRKKKACRKQQK